MMRSGWYWSCLRWLRLIAVIWSMLCLAGSTEVRGGEGSAGQVGRGGWADHAARPCGVFQHVQVMEPIGAAKGSASRRRVPVALTTGKPSRTQYSMPPIISLTR